MNNKLKAYVRFDGSGRIVPSSVILQRSKSKVGNWKEISATECCDFIPPIPCPDVNINGQIWTSCNLDVSKYRNGDIIPQVTDPVEWASLTTGAWCYYDNDPVNAIYGKIYNWYAVNDPRGITPIGYHVPTNTEWDSLVTYVDNFEGNVGGGKLKEIGTAHWNDPNVGATNSTNFTAFGGGSRLYNGVFSNLKAYGVFWTSTEYDSSQGWDYNIKVANTEISVYHTSKKWGFSVRLIKD